MAWTVDSVVSKLRRPPLTPIPAPQYTPPPPGETREQLGFAVESMKRHMTDEGWQLFDGLSHNGYQLCGYQLPINTTVIRSLLATRKLSIAVVQDKREWDVQEHNFREKQARFKHIELLGRDPSIFTVTVLKDAHQNPTYHRASAIEIACNAWIIYYHPRIVCQVAPYVRPQHLIRVHHSLDQTLVPEYSPENRHGALLSGAVSGAYPLRQRLVSTHSMMPQVTYVKHPGYHMNGCQTPAFLRMLCDYKVAICTSSRYGYALRKIPEATACGCIVLTDLPKDEVMPEIDGNLIRIHPNESIHEISRILAKAYTDYDAARQRDFAERAKAYYDFHAAGTRLANDIESLRQSYTNQ